MLDEKRLAQHNIHNDLQQIQDEKATPKTFIFNNPKDIQKQEINLQNLIENT